MMVLPIPRIFQKTLFSCGASCLQMMVAADGIRLSHLRAIWLLRAFPDGTDMDVFCRVYRRLTGRPIRQVTLAGVKRALNRGVPVVAHDSVQAPEDHVVVVVGWEKDSFWVHDPALFALGKGLRKSLRSGSELKDAAGNVFYAPGGSGSRKLVESLDGEAKILSNAPRLRGFT